MSAPVSRPEATGSPWVPLVVFVLASFVFSGVLGVVQGLSGVDAELLTFAQFGPALGAALTWIAFRKRLRAFMPEAVSGRQVGAHTVLMVLAVAVFAAISVALVLATGGEIEGVAAVAGSPFVLYLVLQLVGATGEEIGWRGFMQPALESRMRRFTAALATGAVWAVWHVQIFTAGPAVAGAFIVSTLAFSVLLAFMGNGSAWQRILTAAIGHWLINVSLHTVAGERVNESPQVYITVAAGVVTAAVFLALFAAAQRKRRAKAVPA
ncbi:type II CAAX endopeptidase family protein [Glycomyces sp. NPDC046736]|uniref:CPBP family intramembrane glutamic endopeptidase n=1 Tax=Glycomyces sp. NPDC046736 TaxID=3155615 RepID=UPI0033D844E4